MPLSVRPKVYTLPSYSLTGDLLGFLRCGLQYRYTRLGRLPSTRPVQLWFGLFIHGVLEEAFRRYKESVRVGAANLPPWTESTIQEICDLIRTRLASQGLRAWDPDLESLGNRRAEVAIQEMGPYLLPVINQVEVRLTGTQKLPPISSQLQFREADRYEIAGIVDVITNLELSDPALATNPVVQGILARLPANPPERFEVIVDYKGTRRPPRQQDSTGTPGLWEQYAWQVMTYADLRLRRPDVLPVVAGVLVYVNELLPSRSDMQWLKREIRSGTTDVPPAPGSVEEKLILGWTTRSPVPTIPFSYRLRRALRVVPVDSVAIQNALQEFDQVVRRIETCFGREVKGEPILKAWERNADDEGTCTVCDYRTFCPDYQKTWSNKSGDVRPRLPAVRSS